MINTKVSSPGPLSTLSRDFVVLAKGDRQVERLGFARLAILQYDPPQEFVKKRDEIVDLLGELIEAENEANR